jgi:RHS repeat-associated protein
MVDGTGTTTYTYDAAGRPTQIAGPTGTVGYEWNDLGQLVELAYPDSSVVARTYDDAGQLQTLTDWDGEDYAFDWTEDGQLTAITYPNGVQTTTQYDDAGRAETITTTDPVGAELLDLAYEYSDAGLQTSATTIRSGITDLTAGYSWDGQARLDTIAGTLTGDVDFSPADQVTTLPDGTTLTYDTAGQLLTATTGTDVTAFGYDGRGNRVSEEDTSGIRALAYDSADRLVSVEGDGGDTWSYTYDGDGVRSSATRIEASGVSESDFAWDQTAAVPLLLSDGEHSYLYGLGTAPMAQRDGTGQQEYLHGDALGSIRTVTDSAGSAIAESNYQPYGLATSTAEPVAVVTRFGFAGEYTDLTGLLYLRARYYDPTTAQFVTIDPLVGRTLTAYGYTGGNPLQYVDPLGLEWWEWLIDSNDESLVLNALQSFGSGMLDGGIGTLNLLNGLTAGGWDVYPYVGNPNDCGGIYDGSYYVGQVTLGALAFVVGARATTGRSSSAGASASEAGAATAVDGLPGLPAAAPMPLGRGSTGRTVPQSLTEQLAMEEVRAAPGGTALTKLTLTDTRWPPSEGWVKMQQLVNGVNIHYVRNVITGAVDDFKFK